MKQTYPVPKPQQQKVQQTAQREKVKSISYGYIPDNPKEKQKIARPYLMIKPKLIEEVDENNMKMMKLSFHNSISDLQTFEDKMAAEEKNLESTPTLCIIQSTKATSKHARTSMRHLTQL